MSAPQALRRLVEEAHERGGSIDLAAAVYGPDTGNQRGFLDVTMSYYPLLAGLVAHTGTRTVVEIGTHFGGSTLALLAGLRAGGATDGLLVTMDVTDLNRERLEVEPEIVKVIGDSTEPGFVEGVAVQLPEGRAAELLYIDALKDASYVLTTLHNVQRAGMRPRWVVLDDIAANESMRSLWALLERELPDAAYLISEDRPDIRDPTYGYAILDLEGTDLLDRVPALLDSLGLDGSGLDRTQPGERFAAVAALEPSTLGELVQEIARAHLAPAADVVSFGGTGALTRSLAEGVALNESLGDPRRRVHSYRSQRETADDHHAAIGPRSELVNVFDVELNVAGWCGRRVGYAVASGVSTPRGFAQLLAAFGPSMMVGSTVLLSTDAIAPYRPYQAYVLGYLADHFTVLRTCGLGVALGYTRAVPEDMIVRLVENRFDVDERIGLARSLSQRLDGEAASGFLAQAVRLALPFDRARAAELMDELDALPAPEDEKARTRLVQLRDKVSEGSTV